jgi:hypothetical protein
MAGRLRILKDRPNYFIELDYIDEAGKRKIKRTVTDIPVKGNNKRLADAKLKEVLSEYDEYVAHGCTVEPRRLDTRVAAN